MSASAGLLFTLGFSFVSPRTRTVLQRVFPFYDYHPGDPPGRPDGHISASRLMWLLFSGLSWLSCARARG
uniref:Putative secreted peptide n=1 Tax=Anopheles braziliensis TaxID=58242 RepID=A0A2M3ZVB6_9DIPT